VVWTLPEAGLVVDSVQRTVGMAAPEPLALLTVDEILFDILPAADSSAKGLFIAKILIDVHPADNILGLYPPVQVVIDTPGIEVCLMNHGTVRTKALFRSMSNLKDNRFHLAEYRWVA
jgi:hypothetical protein